MEDIIFSSSRTENIYETVKINESLSIIFEIKFLRNKPILNILENFWEYKLHYPNLNRSRNRFRIASGSTQDLCSDRSHPFEL